MCVYFSFAGVDLQVCFEGDAWIIDVSPSTESIRATFDLFQAMEIISDACPVRSSTTTSRESFHIRMNEAKIHVLAKHGSSNLAVTSSLKNLSFRYAFSRGFLFERADDCRYFGAGRKDAVI